MIDDAKLISILDTELGASETYSDDTEGELRDSLSYYLGRPNGREQEGRSQVTSTDVADAIEWIMPQVMESLTKTNEVVAFDPVRPGDERQAEIETDYVYDVVMKQNNGFVTLYQFVKDALMQKVGILKVYYEDDVEVTTATYTGMTQPEIAAIMAEPKAEILEMAERIEVYEGQQIPIFDAKVKITHPNGRIVIECVPREQFRVNADHNSILLADARFTAHVMSKTVSDLVKDGYDFEFLKGLPDSDQQESSSFRFELEDSSYSDNDSADPAMREIGVVESYMYADINEDGVAELVKILAVGYNTVTDILDVEEISMMPWVTTTPIIMSHKFEGLSIFDRLKEIQDQKTMLWRNMFDNLYLQNNQRMIVIEGQVNLDDVLVSRPNGIIRAKNPNAVTPLMTNQLGPEAMGMMNYLDEVKAGRVGVSAEGTSAPQKIGDRVGSEGVDRLMSSKEKLVGLIVRTIAETGMKTLCTMVRDLARQHMDSVIDYNFRGEWVQLDPKNWCRRLKTTVRVGTGTGDRMEQINALQQVIAIQKEALADPASGITKKQLVFNGLDDYCKFMGLNGAHRYFIDPSTQEGQQLDQQIGQMQEQMQQKQQEMEQMQIQSQMALTKAESDKAKAQMANVSLKAQSDSDKSQIEFMKQTHQAEIDLLKARIEELKFFADRKDKADELAYKYDQLQDSTALELTRIEADKQKQEDQNFQQNREATSGSNR